MHGAIQVAMGQVVDKPGRISAVARIERIRCGQAGNDREIRIVTIEVEGGEAEDARRIDFLMIKMGALTAVMLACRIRASHRVEQNRRHCVARPLEKVSGNAAAPPIMRPSAVSPLGVPAAPAPQVAH